jgi:hypothetical protein
MWENRPKKAPPKRSYKIKKAVFSKLTSLASSLSLYGIKKQRDMVHGTDWDTLIILDACRYDYFESEYRNILGKFLNDSKLRKLKSPASWTYTWLNRVFDGKYNFTVYSAHAGINSRSVAGREEYVATDHFKRIVDVWDGGWDTNLGTVRPETVNKVVLEDICRGRFKGKNIIWYLQPHAPWIGKTKLAGRSKDYSDKSAISELKKKFKKGEISRETFQKAYRDNLRLVLENVAKLIPYLSGKIVISADHGELLGEWGLLDHPGHLKFKQLREVPWLEINKKDYLDYKSTKTKSPNKRNPEKDDEALIQQRLQSLGYM